MSTIISRTGCGGLSLISGHTAIMLVVIALLTAGCAGTPRRGQDMSFSQYKAAASPPRVANGAIYQAGYSTGLFEDVRARHVGDILTVILSEETKASKQASTELTKDNSASVDNPTLFGLPLSLSSLTGGNLKSLESKLGANKAFTGDGKSDQSNKLTGSIQVVVVEELPNRVLKIAGQKEISINQGDEYVRITGIVRLQDIRTDNSIPSTQVANAVITYGGEGVVADANDMGWLGKIFNSKWFPF